MEKILILALVLTCLMSCSDDEFSELEQSNLESQLFDEKTQSKEGTPLDSLLLFEIIDISTSVPCDDSDNWTFVALGPKSCHVEMFVPYSLEVDVAELLEKVDAYNELRDVFFEENEIGCTQEVRPEPVDVICVNGEAKLLF